MNLGLDLEEVGTDMTLLSRRPTLTHAPKGNMD